ncbi:MAG: hypothetical protein RLY16_1852 [Bacteroidota bacterium]
MRKWYISLALLVGVNLLQAQTLRQPISAVYIGLGVYSTSQNDVFAYTQNQAALAGADKTEIGVYGERRFMLQETSVYTLAAAFPTKKGNFGVNVRYSGFKNFNENQIGLAYARRLSKKVDLGVQFNYYGYRVATINSASTVNVELGLLLHLTDKLNAGFHMYNPVGGNFSKTGEKLSSAYSAGLGYDASDKFFVSAELVKEENFPVNLHAGMQYRFNRQFFARAGVASANSTGFAGVGIAWSHFRLDISGSYHPQLGLSPGLLLIMQLGKESADATTNSNQVSY